MISQILLVLAAAAAQCSAQDRKWEFMQPRPLAQPAANPGILDIQGAENAFPAWYHMPPKVQHSPTYGAYERRPEQVDPAYRGYPSFSRQPPTQQQPFEAPRRPFPQPDIDDRTAVEKYHKLLLRKRPQPRVAGPRGPLVPERLRPHVGPPRASTAAPFAGLSYTPSPVLRKLKTARPIVNKVRERLKLQKLPTAESSSAASALPLATASTGSSSAGQRATTTTPFAGPTPPSFPITAEPRPTKARFVCNKTLSSAERAARAKRPQIDAFVRVTAPPTQLQWPTTPPPRDLILKPMARFTLLDLLSWPNAELFNAIRDVVNKFKASLDESGLDQDVRHMGRQLQNTWQQLRAGLDRSWNALRLSAEQSLHPTVIPFSSQSRISPYGSMNEQLSQMFARSQANDAPKT